MPGCLSGAYDATDILCWRGAYDEHDRVTISAEALNSLLAVVEPVVNELYLVGILQGACGGGKADAVFGEIGLRLGLIPFILHVSIVPNTGTGVKRLDRFEGPGFKPALPRQAALVVGSGSG
jgi:hypothetical protein